MTNLNDQQLNNVSGGGANGNFWQEGAAIYYRVVAGDTLSQIAQRAQVPDFLNISLVKGRKCV